MASSPAPGQRADPERIILGRGEGQRLGDSSAARSSAGGGLGWAVSPSLLHCQEGRGAERDSGASAEPPGGPCGGDWGRGEGTRAKGLGGALEAVVRKEGEARA